MAFINERFPPNISFGAVERIRYSTSVIQVNSGKTVRNRNWAFPLREFDVSHAARIESDFKQIIAFDQAVAQGQSNSFRFKPWGDFKVAAGEGVLQLLTSTTWQLARRYTFGATTNDRPIFLPVAAAVNFTGGGVYSLDDTTGIVTKVSGADPTGWAGEFDVRCYMGVDLSEYTLQARNGAGLIMGADSITLMEER